MPIPVLLREVAEEIDGAPNEMTPYLNRRTGELFTVGDEEARLVDDDEEEPEEELADWQQELLPKVREVLASDDWLELPSQFDIHEWGIMRDFAAQSPTDESRDALLNAIHGSGAFRFFRSEVDRLGLLQQWYAFRTAAIEQIAADFLEAEEIPFTRS